MKNRKNADEGAQFLAVAVVIGFVIFVVKTVLELLF